MELTGSCMCGRVSYRVSGPLLNMTWCFCVTCQQQSGCAFIPFAGFSIPTVTWDREPDIWNASDIAERYSCRQCGSAMGMKYHFGSGTTYIAAGSINEKQQTGLEPDCHIFLKDKPAWFTLPDDGVERFQEFPGDFNKRFTEWKEKQQHVVKH